jgi:putative aldouronate transport system permease protein
MKINERKKSGSFFTELKYHKTLYLMCVPAIIFFIIFNYMPIAGLVVAFKNFNFRDGLFGSPWVGFENFEFIIKSDMVVRVIFNTIFLNIIFIIAGISLGILFSLLLNETSMKFRKFIQPIMLLPYFLSWVAIAAIVYSMLSYDIGSINALLGKLGMEPVNMYNKPRLWPGILTFINTWKNVGINTVIYTAVLTGINPSYYEAADIDGASRMQKIFHISIPMLIPTVIVLTLLSIGRILNADFGLFFNIIGNNSILYKTADVVDTFVYRSLRQLGDIGMAAAVSFLQSVVGFIFILTMNFLVRKINRENALF